MPQATRLFSTAGSANPAKYELHTADVSRDNVFSPQRCFCDHFRPRGGNFDSSRARSNRRGHSFVLSEWNTFSGRVCWVRLREVEEGKAIGHLCERENRVNCKGLWVGHGFYFHKSFPLQPLLSSDVCLLCLGWENCFLFHDKLDCFSIKGYQKCCFRNKNIYKFGAKSLNVEKNVLKEQLKWLLAI